MSKHPTNPHDQFFRISMQNKKVAIEFLKTHLPQEIFALINLEKLTVESRSYVDDLRKESVVDVLFKTEIGNEGFYIYILLEHQSTPDELMPFRLIKYTCNIIDDHLKTHNTKKLPLIYPIVVYNGKQKYPYSTDISDCVEAPRELVDKYFLRPFHLIDLGQIDDSIIKERVWAGLMEFALKHRFRQDILTYLKQMSFFLAKIRQAEDSEYIGIVLQYVLEKGNVDEQAFISWAETQVLEEEGETVMNFLQKWKEEAKLEGERRGELRGERRGELRGKMEEKIKTASNMLAMGCEISFIVRATELSVERIQELQVQKCKTVCD